MAKVLICDRCNASDHQLDFDHFDIYREDSMGKIRDAYKLDLCGMCSTEFREFYRVAWSKPNAQTA